MGGTLLIGGIVGIALGAVMIFTSGSARSLSMSERVARFAVGVSSVGLVAMVTGTVLLINGGM